METVLSPDNGHAYITSVFLLLRLSLMPVFPTPEWSNNFYLSLRAASCKQLLFHAFLPPNSHNMFKVLALSYIHFLPHIF
jgi:hypothetical protein